jgi:hypothetical protein
MPLVVAEHMSDAVMRNDPKLFWHLFLVSTTNTVTAMIKEELVQILRRSVVLLKKVEFGG